MGTAPRNKRDQELKLRAMHVASQLPADPEEARKILAYAMDIVDQFMRAEAKRSDEG